MTAAPVVPLRVVHVINNLPVGGAERFLVLLASAQRRRGFEVDVVTLVSPNPLAAALEAHAVPWHCLGRGRLNDLRLGLDLWRYLRHRRPHVVHTHLFYADVCGRVAARAAGVPAVVGTEHSTEATPLSWRRRALMRFTAPLSHALVAVSESVRDATRARSGRTKREIEVIPNGIAIEEWADAVPLDADALGVPSNAIRIGCVGRLAPEKGLEVVIEALARIPDPRLHLFLVGDGSNRDALATLARTLAIADRVHFLGWRTDVARLLRSFDVFAMPSRYEGHSMALLEAMAAGCACIVSNIPELVQPMDGAGWLAAAGDAGDWARAPQPAIASPDPRRELGPAARRIAARSSIETSAAAYERLYEQLVPPHARTAR